MVQVNTPITVRIKFKKVGALQYISHLDLVRTMHKVIVRSSLPLWYTEGFNPKPKMVFAAPLSIGTESLCEFMDLRLTERADEKYIKDALNKNLTDEMQVSEVYYPESKLVDMKWLSYTIVLKTVGASEDLATLCESTLLADVLEIEKETKGGLKTVDIRPLIRSASAVFSGGEIRISATLSADQSAFLNPELVVRALREKLGVLSSGDLLSEYYSILRECAYFDDMTAFR